VPCPKRVNKGGDSMDLYVNVRVVFKNGEQLMFTIKSFSDIEKRIKSALGYNMNMIQTIHFGG
jgi:hypothetical protein